MWAAPDDVRARWIGDDLDIDDDALTTLIEDAEDAITVAIPGIQQMIDAGTIPIVRATRVTARIVARFLRNPTGIRSVQETTGQFTGSTTYAGDDLGQISVTEADRRDLLGKSDPGRKAFSIMPGGIR